MMFFLAQAHENAAITPASVTVSSLVAILALVFAGLAFAAARRRGNRALHVVAVAFLVFAAKNIFSAYNVGRHVVPHDTIELVLSLFDLVLLLLLFAPFMLRRGSP
jgi:hypothetical protein